MRPLIVTVEDRATGASARYAYLRSPVTVGREPGSDLPLAAAFVSGRHGILQFDGDEVRFTDLGTRNGSTLDGVALTPGAPALLAPGGELRIGDLSLRIARGTAPARDAASAPAPAGALTALLERLARTPDYAAADAAAWSLQPGRVLGRFELEREIGRGGFGVVFEARDRTLGRKVALKAVRPGEHARRLADGWLAREAETAAQLNHPNIVSLHDLGAWEGGPYLIMELLHGEPLDARLARGPLPLGEALRIAIDVARAIAHAHREGVVHRDLKPSNVFLVEQGWAKVLDFGLAHVFGGEAPLRAGTLRYMAPEQRRGEPTDARSDVYSAALVLHETLVGVLPAGEVIAPTAYPDAPAALAALVGRALSAEREGRPADGRAWLEALLAVQRSAAGDGETGGAP